LHKAGKEAGIMEALYRVEKVSPIADSHGGNSGEGFIFKKKKNAASDASFKPLFNEVSASALNSRSAQKVFDGILSL
jgi:hypothetical protein